jgi:hypothetical protein
VRNACFQAGNISIADDRVVFVELPHHFLVCAAGRNDDAIFDYADFYATSTFSALTSPKSISRGTAIQFLPIYFFGKSLQ